MPNTAQRLFAALPDALTAAVFLIAWIAPGIPGPHYVDSLTLTMMIEFIVMHSSVFYACLAASDAPRAQRVRLLAGLTGVYLTFILGYSLVYASFWPIVAFAWLFACRFMHLWTHPVEAPTEIRRMMLLWLGSALAYVFGAMLTAYLPLPHLGMTPEFIASMHLSGSGEWIERPYTVLAFGLLYFSLQAAMKYALTGLAPVPPEEAAHGGARRIVTAVNATLRSMR